MDAMRGIDPSSSKFHTQAARNISQVGFGAVRNQKEIKPDDDEGLKLHDDVKLSVKASVNVDAQDQVENSAMSGELGELADDMTEDQDELAVKNKRARERKELASQYVDHDGEVYTDKQVNRMREMDDPDLQISELLKDIPQANLQAAQNILAGQIRQGEPTQALTQLKPVEGVGDFELQRAEPVGVLEIHDTAHPPMSVELTEAMPAEQQTAMAEMMLDRSIDALPQDRKTVVDELRTAVNTWARENSADPGPAFAEKLHALASGWEDEGLQVAAKTYVEVAGAGAAQ